MTHSSHTLLAAASLAISAGCVAATGILRGQDIADDTTGGYVEFAVDPVALMTLPVGALESLRGTIPCSPLVEPATRFNAGIAARAACIIGDPDARSAGLRALSIAVGYDDLTSLFTSSPNDSYEGYDPINNIYQRIVTRQSVLFTLRSIRTALELEIALGGGILFRAGPSCSIPIAGSSRERDVVVSPSNATFLDKTQQREVPEGTGDLGAIGVRLGMGAVLAWRLPLGNHLFLEPMVGADMGLTPVQPSWTPLVLRGGIGLGHAAAPWSPPPAPIAEMMPATEPAPAGATPFMAIPRIDLLSDGGPIRLRRQIVARYVPLLPVIFFDKDSAAIPSRYGGIHPGVAMNFDEGRLPGNAEEAHRQVLDVIGKRLSEHPRARLTVTGATSIDESNRPVLARRRADAVAAYLIDRWGIDRRRITIASRSEPAVPSNSEHPEGRQENRRVEIVASQEELERPVQIRSVEPTIEPNEVAFITGVSSQSPIERWRIDITAGDGGPVRRIEGAGSPEGIMRWELSQADRERMLSGGDLFYRMSVYDGAGQSAETVPRLLPLQLDTTISIASAAGRPDNSAEFLLLRFEYDRSELTRRGGRDIASVLERIGPGSAVSIIGYTDSTGEIGHNRELALERARRVAAMIPAGVKADYRGASPDEAPYGSGSPEGRFLSRTVRIIITDPK